MKVFYTYDLTGLFIIIFGLWVAESHALGSNGSPFCLWKGDLDCGDYDILCTGRGFIDCTGNDNDLGFQAAVNFMDNPAVKQLKGKCPNIRNIVKGLMKAKETNANDVSIFDIFSDDTEEMESNPDGFPKAKETTANDVSIFDIFSDDTEEMESNPDGFPKAKETNANDVSIFDIFSDDTEEMESNPDGFPNDEGTGEFLSSLLGPGLKIPKEKHLSEIFSLQKKIDNQEENIDNVNERIVTEENVHSRYDIQPQRKQTDQLLNKGEIKVDMVQTLENVSLNVFDNDKANTTLSLEDLNITDSFADFSLMDIINKDSQSSIKTAEHYQKMEATTIRNFFPFTYVSGLSNENRKATPVKEKRSLHLRPPEMSGHNRLPKSPMGRMRSNQRNHLRSRTNHGAFELQRRHQVMLNMLKDLRKSRSFKMGHVTTEVALRILAADILHKLQSTSSRNNRDVTYARSKIMGELTAGTCRVYNMTCQEKPLLSVCSGFAFGGCVDRGRMLVEKIPRIMMAVFIIIASVAGIILLLLLVKTFNRIVDRSISPREPNRVRELPSTEMAENDYPHRAQ